MTAADRELAVEWLETAEQDLVAAERILAGEPPVVSPALFHCQQAAEKALKAVLVSEGTLPPRTHDLGLLWALAAKIAGWKEPAGDVNLLTDYAVEPRYPPHREYEVEEARTALEEARAIVSAVREVLE